MTLLLRGLRLTAVGLAILTTAACSPAGEADALAGSEGELIADTPLSGDVPEGTDVRTSNDLHLRTGPDKTFDSVAVIPEGATATVVNRTPENGFYEVRYGDATGWASGKYLELADQGSAPGGNVVSSGTCKTSYYESGQRTANGERFEPDGITAAHRTLPFGTSVRVTNTANGQSVVVRINDRGPFVGDRCLDLSRGAFRAIAPLSAGVANVKYEVLQ